MSTIRENLLVLIEAVTNEPEHLFDLTNFEKKEPCGTLHCTLGLATTLPHFYMQGLVMQPAEKERAACPAADGIRAYQPSCYAKLDALFGEESYCRLFEPAEGGEWDVELLAPDMPDKELALARLNKQLENYPDPQ